MAKSEFQYSSPFKVTDEMKRSFEDKGYILVRGLIEEDELAKVKKIAENREFHDNAFVTDDGTGKKSRVTIWSYPGNDVTGMISRSQRVAGTCAELLGGEIYHYHSKFTMKDARTGGGFVWHQDYGYWYQNGILKPDMMSVFIPIDNCQKSNGCLQILEGSHKCGRIDHGREGGQTGANLERLQLIKSQFPHLYVEMNADDGTGKKSRVTIWSYPGNDVTGMISRSQRVAGTCAELLGGEIYHYHSKFTMKDARTGGGFVWHQDYGYWYQNGILKPDMMSVFIPIDNCQKSNGCLQILEGSHKCGRIDHGREGGQTGANLERLQLIKSQFPHLYVEMNAGDALFFHCNVLHTSSPNQSDERRWVFIACYNKASNNPVVEHHFPRYNKLDIVPDEALGACTNFTDLTGKKFMNPSDNKTIVASRA